MTRKNSASVVAQQAEARYVFRFSEGSRQDASILGGKGASLAHLTSLGLPVPPGFTISCRAGVAFLRENRIPAEALQEIRSHLESLEQTTGRAFNHPQTPLFVSVRSGAPVSMPGMMDTVLNVGLNSGTVRTLSDETGDAAFAWACYERLVESYARIVRGCSADDMDECLSGLPAAPGEERSRAIVEAVLKLMAQGERGPMPEDPIAQILETIEAVFRSWTSPRAQAYRRFKGIDERLGTAATVQTMVFGNRGASSASGVAFTRDPATGDPGAFGDILFKAQGEDVVSGERDVRPLSTLRELMPEVYRELEAALVALERDTRELCEVEFTIEQGKLWILQTRVGMRSGRAAVRAAVDFVEEGLIEIDEAIGRVTPAQIEAAAAPVFSRMPESGEVLLVGMPASPGAAVGKAAFDAARAVTMADRGEDVILFRPTTSPSDVAGFIAARGVVTGRGGRTCHAAVVARGMGRAAVCGVGALDVAPDLQSATVQGGVLREGELVSVDGDRGIVARGALPFGAAADNQALQELLRWCDKRARVPFVKRELIGEAQTLQAGNTDLKSLDPARLVVLELDDPRDLSARQAGEFLSAAEKAGVAPYLKISRRWAAAADRQLEGKVSGIVTEGSPTSAWLMACTLRPG